MARIGFVLSYCLLELLDKVYFYNVRYHLMLKARENRNWLCSNLGCLHRKPALYPFCLGLTVKLGVVFIRTVTRGIYSQYYRKNSIVWLASKITSAAPKTLSPNGPLEWQLRIILSSTSFLSPLSRTVKRRQLSYDRHCTSWNWTHIVEHQHPLIW